MGFQQGLSGLNAAAKSLEAIGNNVSNAATVGFKQAQVQFADVFASSLTGSGGSQIGIGTKMARVSQQFTQGNISGTNNPLDIAINGNGFFRMVDGRGAESYSRNGQFQLNQEGFIQNAAGHRLTGYILNDRGAPENIGEPKPIAITDAPFAPNPTKKYDLSLNLDSGADVKAIAFDGGDPDTYNFSTSVPVYDSLGNSHTLQSFYVNKGNGVWDVYGTLNDQPVGPAVPVAGAHNPFAQLQFGSGGQLNTTTAFAATPASTTTAPWIDVTPAVLGNNAAPLKVDVNFLSTMTQYGADFAVNKQFQDGYASGELTGFSLSSDGNILGRYTNGQTKALAQVTLTTFENPNGLQSIGNNAWVRTSEAGEANHNEPGTGGSGAVQSSAVEDSNVDLTAELVNMITAQRIYQANAQTIKTEDQIMQTLVNLR
jgi:flagellar hook protein FlgE